MAKKKGEDGIDGAEGARGSVGSKGEKAERLQSPLLLSNVRTPEYYTNTTNSAGSTWTVSPSGYQVMYNPSTTSAIYTSASSVLSNATGTAVSIS